MKLAGAGVDVDAFDWQRSYFGDRAVVRSELTAAARTDLAGLPGVIIGDTPSDGSAAAAAGLHFIAVATGAFDEATLRGTGAVLVVPDLEQGLPAVLAALAELADAQESSARR